MQAWPARRMDELCEITSSKRIFAADYVSAGVPFYRGREITEKYKGNLDVSTELFITEEKFAEIERKFGAPRHGDLLLTSVGTLGSVYVVKPGDRFYFKDGNLTWFRHFKGIDSQFLYYWIGSPMGKAELRKCTIGSSQSAFTIVLLKGMEIGLPPLPVQRRIAGILSAYDDLIENSQRRIKILEAMARTRYREWFVHFRFPGHENHPRVASPLGAIPQGWEMRKLFELTKVNYGKNLPTKKLADDGAYPVYGAAKIIGRYTEYTREMRTIICGCRGSVGELQITQPQCYVTNNSFAFDPTHPDNFFWLFHTLKERGLRDVVGGAAQPQITLEGISSVELITPPLQIRTRFQQIASAFFHQVWTLDSQVQNLRRTRDLLLPRLLSGQATLDELEAA
jgi:type I restriction enzyme, S subunit